MILERVRLRNIKSFVDQELFFGGGINIIAGRNGSGKSTVIEAVGLALFDCWPQKFKDGNAYAGFIRRGTREGQIDVDVRCGGRRYTVRCELGSRTVGGRERIDYERSLCDDSGAVLASSGGRKKEFQDDIREHVLGAARIDDDKLFRDIIGTEQGGFDEPFTRTEQQRRALFEKILGIEDFQDFEKRFWSLVKMEEKEAADLELQLGEHVDVPRRVGEAEEELLRRTKEAGAAADHLTRISGEVNALRARVEALSGLRESLQQAIADRRRLEEKLLGEQAREEETRRSLDDAKAAADAVLRALPGHEAYLAAEKEIQDLRKAARERDEAKAKLASLGKRYAEKSGGLQARKEAAEKRSVELTDEIAALETAVAGHGERIASLRAEYADLQKAQVAARKRAEFAREVSSYVQDLDTVQRTLDNVGERMHTLDGTLSMLDNRQRELSVDVAFFPRLHDESRQLFSRYSTETVTHGDGTPFTPMLREAEALERRLRAEADAAAKALSVKETEGQAERRQLEDAEQRLTERKKKRDAVVNDLRAIDDEAGKLRAAWEEESGRLNDLLGRHADLEERIETLERRLEEHGPAHEEYLRRKSAADTMEKREHALSELFKGMQATRTDISDVSKRIDALEERFSNEEYEEAREGLDRTRAGEQEAVEAHSGWKARVEEQQDQLKELRKRLREFERLRARADYARVEAAFTSDVHRKVVRELARHVGASIVQALSGFADELYQRLAPEQGARLHWDPQSYAVELRRGVDVITGRELSGGQLMGVSLAVKLALIKWYAQCRIGFLDEPTTHLDRETRAHLAEVIKSLDDLAGDDDRWFDQLFVISHEESFQGAGHRIELARDENGVSSVAAVE